MTIALSLISGCAIFKSKQERAQSKLARAIALDPSIMKSTVNIKDSLRITDSIRIKDSVTIIPGHKTEINLGNPCDTTGFLKPFDYVYGQGGFNIRVWGDSTGVHVQHSMDSILLRNRELERKLKESQKRVEVTEKIVTITQYRTAVWKLAVAAVFGFFVGFIPFLLKLILKTAGKAL